MEMSVPAARIKGAAADTADADGFRQRTVGLSVGTLGWLAAMLAFVISLTTAGAIAAGASASRVAALDVLSFGIAIAALGTGKTGIALVLWGIVRRIGRRAESITAALPALVTGSDGASNVQLGIVRTALGRVRVSSAAPRALFVHRIARLMWAPMLLMGLMALFAGLGMAIAASGSADPAVARSLKAWVQGVQFLGEGFLLSGISFLLGTILGAIRAAGGDVQQSLGVEVKTLLMPVAAKLFLALMIAGLMVEIAQFFFYVYVASLTDGATVAAYSTWLGPFREFGLGLLLSGVVLALATIARALDFQFSRIRELITAGR